MSDTDITSTPSPAPASSPDGDAPAMGMTTPPGGADAPEADAGLVRLAECPPGLFLFNGSLGFKSEYGIHPCFCADSGEYFWGGVATTEARDDLMVLPVDAARLAAAEFARRDADAENAALRKFVQAVYGRSVQRCSGIGGQTIQATLARVFYSTRFTHAEWCELCDALDAATLPAALAAPGIAERTTHDPR